MHEKMERYDVLYTVLGSVDREAVGYQTAAKHARRRLSCQYLTDRYAYFESTKTKCHVATTGPPCSVKRCSSGSNSY